MSPAFARSGRKFDRSARGLKPADLPSVRSISSRWEELKDEAARQGRLDIPDLIRDGDLCSTYAARIGALALFVNTRGRGAHRKLFSAAILEDYRSHLNQLRDVGYGTYARRQLSPYLRACVDQFSRQQRSVTERLIERIRKN